MHVVTAKLNDKLVGLFPILVRSGKKIAEDMAGKFGDYGGMLIADDITDNEELAKLLIEAVFKSTGVARLRLRRLHTENKTSSAVLNVFRKKTFAYERMRGSSTFYLPLENNFEESLTVLRSSKSRYNLRRALKQLGETGEVDFELCTTPETRAACLGELKVMHAARWPEGLYSTDAGFSFIKKIVDTKGENCKLMRLKLDNKTIAVQLGFISGSSYYYYNVAYDETFGKFSPGSLLLRNGLELACQNKCDNFDLLMGPEPYKQEWGATPVTLETITTYSPFSFAGKFLGIITSLRNRRLVD